MHDPRTDQIAREAARLMHDGRAADINRAIRAAADHLKAHDAPLPGPGRVRQHARAMSMQAIGDDGYAKSVHAVLSVAEEMMTLFAEMTTGVEPVLVGRAAAGLVDADATLHIRLYTNTAIGELAELLVAHGYEEPEFQTVETRFGRLNRMHIVEQGIPIVITRCMPPTKLSVGEDLFTEKSIEVANLAELRLRLEAS